MSDAARVQLRPVADADLAVHFEQQRDPASAAMAAVPIRDRAAFDAQWATLLADSDAVLRSIVLDGEVVGSALSFLRDGTRHVGYRIAQEHWGRGIASAALALLVEELGERPLEARVAIHNPASLRVLEKAGFRRVGQGVGDDGVTLHHLQLG